MEKDTVIFKQSYKSRTVPSTRVLNLKHLEYIATRPGVIRNPECGFGCFGQLTGMKAMENINDLRTAQKEISEASEHHTVYRAILSVSKETAQAHNLYDRAEWEKLLRSDINTIAMEMHIKRSDLRWVASVHYKKNHPHVHIMYWDAGKEPKREYINPEQFQRVSDHIRSSFAAKILYGNELKEMAAEKDEAVKAARLKLSAMLREANVAEALDLDKISRQKLDALGRELTELAIHLPAKGSLKYDYLSPAYKARLDAYLDHVLELKEFSKVSGRYEELTAQISKLYGNTGELEQHYREEAKKMLRKELGNETLRYLREIVRELQQQTPAQNEAELDEAVRSAVRQILSSSEKYEELRHSMPRHRTPMGELMKDAEFRAKVNNLTNELCQDIRIRAKTDAYLHSGSRDTAAKEDTYHRLWKSVHEEVLKELQEDAGYAADARAETAASALLSLFRFIGQSTNQKQAQKDLKREKYRNLSATAKRDRRKELQQRGSWELE